MNLYLRFIGNAYQENMMYKMNTLISFISLVISLFVQISVWYALYAGNETTFTNTGEISFDEMIHYLIISSGVSIIINNQIIGKMDGKIKTGMIAMDLIKPMNFCANLLCLTIGNNIFRITFQLIPLVIMSLFVFDISFPSSSSFLLFIISIINAFFINFFLSYILGMIGFWYLSVWHLERFQQDVVRLFGGVWIPLWFFPESLNLILKYLPFQYIYFIPINIYLEKTSYYGALSMLLNQFIWIAFLGLLGFILWQKGKHKLVIQGG